jgi:hypothetical protein
MPFPTLKPASRDFKTGDYPVKTFKAQSGVEARILYGSKRTGMALSLGYENIPDGSADDFVAHFDEVKGTFDTFTLPDEVLAGWQGASTALDAAATGNRWRYAEAPQVSAVRPGKSSVRVSLIGVL